MSNVVVLDNGGGLMKAGLGGERDPTCVVPNCTARPLSSKKWLLADQLLSPTEDLTSATLRRPFDRGHLINPDLQSSLWAHLFTNLLKIHPPNSSLLLTEPLFTLPSIQRSVDEIIFEDFNFKALFVSDSPSLVHLYEASRRPYGTVSKAQCSLVVDCGFSFTHAAPVFQNFTLNYGVRRMDLGGKALTNYLKELVSYRSVNVMDESFIMDDVKEKLCFVSLDVQRDLKIARRPGNDNIFDCTYVLPDGITYMKGFVKDSNEANRYLALNDGAPSSAEEKQYLERRDVTDKPQERRNIDLTKTPDFRCLAWGSLLASSPDFEAMCVTKAEYEELGSARCRRRFFH
ncbi:hypothetical protein DH2020_010744 [Rehmannia glutinosa]|uniref:Actin-related protein 6 n=1 Tax=Rehmannia glutinosa TaxID=99300 RepID=A0ABR0XC55_REHGL